VAPVLCYVEMLFIDYGIVRILYNNRHRISKDAWRSAQPAPHHVGWMARRGIKTIINLRGGEQSFGTRWLEEHACARHGIALVDLKLKSRAAPTSAELRAMKDLLGRVEYPILVHCKSGADRAGLMSLIVRHVRDGVPIREAREQLSLRYGHVRSADTGVIDAVFDRYLEEEARTGIAFWDWVDKHYDPDEINRTFRARGWANRLVNGILRRE
jgi:protein tyrosine/serine phosphatase